MSITPYSSEVPDTYTVTLSVTSSSGASDTESITVVVPEPDFEIKDTDVFFSHTSAWINASGDSQLVTVYAKVRNKGGNVDVAGNTATTVDVLFTVDGATIDVKYLTALNHGSESSVSVSFKPSRAHSDNESGLPVEVRVDQFNNLDGRESRDKAILESDETNNEGTVHFKVVRIEDTIPLSSKGCYVGFGYPIPLGGGDTTVGSEIEMCEGNPTNTSAIKTVTDKDSGGNWIVTIIVPFDGWKANPNLQASVNSVHWYLLDTMANTVSDGLVSEVYGYYPGEGKAVIFVDNDFDGKLSPGDKFEIHPGESGSDLANVGSVDDYTFWLYYFTDTPPAVPAGGGGYAVCLPGDTKTADDGCNQCVCNYGEWACTEVDCNPDDSDGVLPAPSLAASLAAVAVIALHRPRKP
jgi:hypothetical protein